MSPTEHVEYAIYGSLEFRCETSIFGTNKFRLRRAVLILLSISDSIYSFIMSGISASAWGNSCGMDYIPERIEKIDIKPFLIWE
jgi:hypothetical protein